MDKLVSTCMKISFQLQLARVTGAFGIGIRQGIAIIGILL